MAKKRMVSNQIVDSDDFLDMPLSAQALYLHLLVRADDEGFMNSVKKVMRMIGSREDDLKVLIGKNFVIMFESGVLVIKHWLVHNTIRKDRITPTAHYEERRQLDVKENKAYTFHKRNKAFGNECLTHDGQMSDKCQSYDRIEEISLDETRLDQNRLVERREPKGSSSVSTDSQASNRDKSRDVTQQKKKEEKEQDKEQEEETKDKEPNGSMSVSTDSKPSSDSSGIDYEGLKNYWNRKSGLTEIRSLTQKRKKFVKVRAKNHGIDALFDVIDNCRRSSFMKGDNSRNWIANFDWVFGNPQNFIKVLEGNYTDKKHNPGSSNDMDRRAERLERMYGSDES